MDVVETMMEARYLLIFAIIPLAILLFVLISKQRKQRSATIEKDINEIRSSLLRVADGQQQLFGGLRTVSEAQSVNQSEILKHVEKRLSEVQRAVSENLTGSANKTASTLGELKQRLVTIDRAQTNIEKLSGNVLGLQDILSNKQARGAFGEIQLNDIVTKALPADAYTFQPTLSNGKRVDCVIHLPNPPGPIAIDSKFPLEAYETLRLANSQESHARAKQAFKTSVRKHIRDISEKYILEGETAEGALMFIPSEAVYAELHSNFSSVVREGFSARVWIVSPTTCMATLNTVRSVLKDANMREQAGRIRTELGMLQKDVDRLELRANNLNRHFELASKDLEEVKVSAKKVSGRVTKIDRFEFDELKAESHLQKPPRKKIQSDL
ncbi:MAG: DNA recombination protein RmuC [Pseudomonadota bacterium]|nr:DNA recombination protein RmuC [Pseudomonadota bacterium]